MVKLDKFIKIAGFLALVFVLIMISTGWFFYQKIGVLDYFKKDNLRFFKI